MDVGATAGLHPVGMMRCICRLVQMPQFKFWGKLLNLSQKASSVLSNFGK